MQLKNLCYSFIVSLFFAPLFVSAKDSTQIDFLTFFKDVRTTPTVGLALSGGGARGISHIGVLLEFEKAGIPLDYIVGTSIGAVIGSLYSSGYRAHELDSIVKSTDWDKILSISNDRVRENLFIDQKRFIDRNIITLNFDNYKFVVPESVSGGEEFKAYLQELFWNAPYKCDGDFDDLKYKFRAVASDLVSGKTVTLGKGDIVSAVTASMAIPLQFAPVRKDSMILADGGLLANLPYFQLEALKPDINIGVDITSPLRTANDINTPWNIADQSISIVMKKNTDEARRKVQFLIEPNIKNYANNNFVDLDSLIVQGRIAAKKMIPQILKKLNSYPTVATKHKRYFVKNINIHAIQAIKNRDLDSIVQKNFALKFADKDYIMKLRENISRILVKRGFSCANIRSLKYDENTETLSILIDEGKINNIFITGNDRTGEFLIRRDLLFKEGNIANATRIVNSWKTLINNSLFSKVDIMLGKSKDKHGIDMHIKVKEKGRQTIQIGARVDGEKNTQFGIDLISYNPLNIGMRFYGRTVLGKRNTSFSLGIENPRISTTSLSFNALGYSKYRKIRQYRSVKTEDISTFKSETNHDFDLDKFGVIFSSGTQVERIGIIGVDLRFERQGYNHSDSSKNRRYNNISTLKFKSMFDTENSIDFTTSGTYFGMELETAFLPTTENVNFSKASIQFRHTLSIGDHSFKPSLHFGMADEALPAPDFFEFGGQDNFYGYAEAEQRGRQYLKASMSYLMKSPINIFFDTYLTFRYDLGSIWKNAESIHTKNLKHGAGIGLAMDTPIGAAKFAVGRAFHFLYNPSVVVKGPLIFYFSIGKRL